MFWGVVGYACVMAYRRCEAIAKKNGNQCRNGAMSHSPFCGSHLDESAIGVWLKRQRPQLGEGLLGFGEDVVSD